VALAAGPRAIGAPVSVIDARGVRVSLRQPPKRIVSLTPGITETLFAIGAGPRVVGVTRYCDYPPQVRSLPKVGDYSTSIEKVVAMKPDLIVADLEANRKAIADLEKLAEVRGKVFVIRATSFSELYASLRKLGQITGCPAGAQKVVSHMQLVINAVKKRVAASRTRPRVLFVVQAQPLWVAGGHTFMDEMIEIAGGSNVGRKAGDGYRSLGLEQLVALDPEVLLSTHATVEELRSRPGWSQVSAVRNKRVHRLGFEAVRPCPRLSDAVVTIYRLLHPTR